MTSGREDHHAQGACDKAVREVRQQVVNRLFCLIHRILHAPVHQRQIRFLTAFIVVAFQYRRGQENLAQHIPQTGRDTFTTLQATAQYRHGDVGQQRQVGAQPVQMLVITFCRIMGWRGAGQPAGQAQPEATHFVASHMTDMFEQQFIEGIHVVILRGSHLFQHVRMATNRPLAEDHHAAGEDVGPFNGDGDRCALIATRQEVAFAEHNAFPARDIHCIND